MPELPIAAIQRCSNDRLPKIAAERPDSLGKENHLQRKRDGRFRNLLQGFDRGSAGGAETGRARK
jgi:hypothetical protein